MWRKKPVKGLSSEQWVTERAARHAAGAEYNYVMGEDGRMAVSTGQFTHSNSGGVVHSHGWHYERAEDGSAVAVPNGDQVPPYTAVEGTVMQNVDGKLYVYGNGAWRPFVKHEPIAGVWDGVEDDDDDEPEPYHFDSF